MTAIQTPPLHAARPSPKAVARPVQQLLLEIAYRLHATRTVGPAPARRPR